MSGLRAPDECTEPPGYPIESVDRALALLLAFEEIDMISVSEASDHLGVSRSTAYRVLSMLQYRGFVRQDARAKAYVAGPSLLRVGLAAVKQLDVRAVVRPLLEKIVERVEETAHLVILQRADAFFLDCVEGPKAIRAAPRTGTSLPAHCTASGKILLAELPRHRLDALLSETRLPALTQHSLTSVAKLRKELAEVREQGYAMNDEESEVGLRAIAMRISHPNVRLSVEAAVTIAGPLTRMADRPVEEFLVQIRAVMDSEFA